MSAASMTIDGEAVPTGATFGVVNPATGAVHAEAPECTQAQLDAAFMSSAAAFGTWKLDEAARRDALRACAAALYGAADTIGPVLTAEQGKPLGQAKMEVFGAGVWFSYYAELEVEPQIIQDDKKAHAEVVRRPMGVVAAITPWNFPLLLAAWKLAPALRAGNTVVLKPSPYTPLSTLMMVQTLNAVLPPGVLNSVSGGDDLGRWMTAHPTPRKVSFTGSVNTGKHVAAAAGADLKRVTLELGGNDAAIVLDDADVEQIAERLYQGAFANAGQTCSAIKRLYVPERLHDDLVERLAARANAVVVGDGMDADVEMGPINNAPQHQRVIGLVDDALASGAKAVAGGERGGGDGYFYRPTILVDAPADSRIVVEEQFGPALPVIRYSDEDAVVLAANGTSFGLSGSVWSADPDRAAAMAARLECGTAWVNAHVALAPHQPFGGHKHSGIGVENGPDGLAGFTDLQVLYRTR